jgi:hypothetical protein
MVDANLRSLNRAHFPYDTRRITEGSPFRSSEPAKNYSFLMSLHTANIKLAKLMGKSCEGLPYRGCLIQR